MCTTEALRRALLPTSLVLLVAVWLGGGVTVDDTSINEWLQLIALPVLGMSLLVLMRDVPDGPFSRWGLLTVVMVAAIPVLQLLPIPQVWWATPPARLALSVDLMQAGVAGLQHRWTLAPAETENAIWSLVPALAIFFAAIGLRADHRRRLAQTVVLLVLFNLLFAFFQVGLPPDSILRLYQDFDPRFGGLLANTNHQATALIIGMVMAVGLSMEARGRAAFVSTRTHLHWWYAGLATCFLMTVPLSTSRAGMAIALPALAGALLLTGGVPLARIGHNKWASAGALLLTLFAVVGGRTAIGWMTVDESEELRHTMSSAAVAIGKLQAPLGSGVGSFIPVFEQGAPSTLWLASYVNHAHNEYAQWWLTTGWLGMLVLATVLVLLLTAGWRIVRLQGRGSQAKLAASCFVAVCAVLAHSWADYPLRTTTLMTTTAALAGLMLASLDDACGREKLRKNKQPDDDSGVQLA
jgi:hypothetical protein